jgi:D-lactate dehydrogenase
MDTYKSFLKDVRCFIPKDRIHTDELRRFAWGTDASFYRLTPRIVILSDNENEVSRLMALSGKYGIPVTFRAAGTSLSGQAVSDSVLIVAGKHWERYHIAEDCNSITLQPGLTGGRVNGILAPFGRKLGPDPASVNSCMIGGIIANNASGMSCGIHANSEEELISARIVLSDGTVLDTGSEESKRAFKVSHPDFVHRIESLRDEVNGEIFDQECHRPEYSAVCPICRSVRHHCTSYRRFGGYPGLSQRSYDEDSPNRPFQCQRNDLF